MGVTLCVWVYRLWVWMHCGLLCRGFGLLWGMACLDAVFGFGVSPGGLLWRFVWCSLLLFVCICMMCSLYF